MQKLKRMPLLQRLGSTLATLLRPVVEQLRPRIKLPKSLTTVALIGLCILTCWLLFGCTPVKTVRSIPPLPPQADARPMPRFLGSTFRDSIMWSIEVREWGTACEADKSVLRRVYGHE